MEGKPFVKWVGGKTQLLDSFDKVLPEKLNNAPFNYIEPFVGGGAMLFHMLQKFDNIESAIANDINSNLIDTYKCIKEEHENLIQCLNQLKTEYNNLSNKESKKEFFLNQRDLFNTKESTRLDQSALFIFLNKTCFNGMYRENSKGKYNVPWGQYEQFSYEEDVIKKDSELLQKVTFYNGDFPSLLEHINGNSFVYLDPPYRPLNPTSSFTSYTKDDFNDDDQRRLKDFIDGLSNNGCDIMLSNSDCSSANPEDLFFEKLYEKYTINKVSAARYINSKGNGRGKINELLIKNF